MSLLEVTELSVSYGAIRAVRDISLEVHPGEVVALLGANGAGKSSTLKGLMGIERKSGGRVLFDGQDISKSPPERIVKNGMTLTPEGRHVFPDLTARENLALGAATVRSRAVEQSRLQELFTRFPILKTRSTQLAGTLSGGEQQQLVIARSLISDPQLLLLDEPSLGLAPIIVEEIFKLIRRLRESGLTILLVEQNVARALEVADRVYVVANGKIALSGAPSEIEAAGSVERTYLGLSG